MLFRRMSAPLALGCLLFGVAAAAVAQLSPADIEALRRRGQQEGWTFQVGLNGATSRPLEQLCGAVEPPDWQVHAIFDPCQPRGELPESFVWYYAAVTPIRDQGACGSCWAFAAIGAMECGMRIRGGGSQDLSEQWLVSCTDAGSCSGGWHTAAFDYLVAGGLQDPCGHSGAPRESDFRYRAMDLPCHCPYPHPYFLDYWRAVGYQWELPSVEQIKQAILDHGPVAACVYVNDAFQAYNGGVFNACEDHWVNHVVVLTGWDDRKGAHGAWRLRNSWGPYWGEQGYMWIEYGCCRVGYATCYVEYDWKDCNSNGIHDRIDLRRFLSPDCNHNYVPDECDIASGANPDENANGVPDECEIRIGDMNCDGVVDGNDVNPFVLALASPAAYRQTYPDCLLANADANGDGRADFGDINAFTALLGP